MKAFRIRKRQERPENDKIEREDQEDRTRSTSPYVSECVYENGGCERRLRLRPEWCYACIEQHEQAEGTAALRREETKRLIRRVEAHMLSHATEEWDAMLLESKWDAMLLSPAARRRVVGAASTWTKKEEVEKVNKTKETSKQVNE